MVPRTRRLRIAATVTGGLLLAGALCCNAGSDATGGVGEAPRPVSQSEALAIGRASAAGGALLLDVRNAAEFGAGHVPGALNIPHTELEARIAELAEHRGDELIVYCERGGRAAVAADILRRNGFDRIGHLAGDMFGWRNGGLPTER